MFEILIFSNSDPQHRGLCEMAAEGGATLEVQQALKRVLKSASVVGGVSRGLHEAAKALDK